ncbi:MAG: 8-oxo-dGTP diphosphatase MutT [Piscirickettsiaceae bacterium]|nr:8-oxo-dGTP diphosphatase MutT [Piscirickettsiaceae bacterium]
MIHVAVAVIVNNEKCVLTALRQGHQHQGGLWEFPGGKVDNNEAVYDALVREIDEELGLSIKSAQPWLEISHNYGDKHVLLDVWLVTEFSGLPEGKEGQTIQWQAISQLNEQDFPAANIAIINELKLRAEHEFS